MTTSVPRFNLGSGSIKFIDGFPFEGLGSAGFEETDLLIRGDDLDNLDLIGGDGHDEIEGEAGNDKFLGGNGNDTLEGDDGNDDLDGQEGTDKLFGGNGDDILRAGGNNPVVIQDGVRLQGDFDRLTGGDGNDTFAFYGYGHFEVTDFNILGQKDSLFQDRIGFDSQILGISSFEELEPSITNYYYDPANFGAGFTVEFDYGAATIEFTNVDINLITMDMVVFL